MFCVTLRMCAPLAALKPILASSVNNHVVVRRFIGMRSSRAHDGQSINSVIEKTHGNGLIGIAAILSRAHMYIAARNPFAAIEEINEVMPRVKNEALRHMALGLRLQARNELLDLKEAALSVSGGSTEAEVSTLRQEVQQDYQALRAIAPTCWLIQLAAAEYTLYTGDAQSAHDAFVEVERKIRSFLGVPATLSTEVASPQTVHPWALLGYQVQRAINTQAVRFENSPLAQEAVQVFSQDQAMIDSMRAFKEQAGVTLSDSEAIAVIFALESAAVRHHYHDFFPLASDYGDWQAPAAVTAKALLENAYVHRNSYLDDGLVNKVRASVPDKAFYGSEDALREVLKSAPRDAEQGSVLAAIRARCGPGPQTPLSARDQSYFEALAQVTASNASRDSAATVGYAQRQQEVTKVLAKQMLYRTQVQRGVALCEMERLQEAVNVITPVIQANEYIYMWRALLARSRAYKGLGLLTLSDKDLKALKPLQKSLSENAPYEMT